MSARLAWAATASRVDALIRSVSAAVVPERSQARITMLCVSACRPISDAASGQNHHFWASSALPGKRAGCSPGIIRGCGSVFPARAVERADHATPVRRQSPDRGCHGVRPLDDCRHRAQASPALVRPIEIPAMCACSTVVAFKCGRALRTTSCGEGTRPAPADGSLRAGRNDEVSASCGRRRPRRGALGVRGRCDAGRASAKAPAARHVAPT
jgi:hypothetical protein